jgi:hypothetical protein
MRMTLFPHFPIDLPLLRSVDGEPQGPCCAERFATRLIRGVL